MKRTAAAAVLATLIMTALPHAEAAPSADRPWSGYRITSSATAGGAWIGARKASGQVVYRIDPSRRKTSTARYRAGTWQSVVSGVGPRRVTRADAARAAWIISKYGAYRYAVQNAAVEVALDELLHGGRWALNGSVTRQRLAQTGQGGDIMRFATTMLRDSARFAGPYAVQVTASAATAGRPVTLTVQVTSTRSGAGIANLPVTLSYAGTSVTGLRTGPEGAVSAEVPATAAGPHDAIAAVGRLPQTRLLVRTPTRKGASRVVVAGQKAHQTVRRVVATQAVPVLTTTSSSPAITTPSAPTGTLSVKGRYPGSARAWAGLYGPFTSAANAACPADRLIAASNVPVAGNGTYALPRLTVTQPGYYIWGAGLARDTYNTAAGVCSGIVLARTQPDITATPISSKVRTGSYTRGQIHVSGLPSGYSNSASLRLYGPFFTASSVNCSATKLKASQYVTVSRNGIIDGPETKVSNLGYYLWAVDLPGSTFTLPRSSSCSAATGVFQVTW